MADTHPTKLGHRTKNLIGRRFGRLEVIALSHYGIDRRGDRFANWTCRCICGEEMTTKGNSLVTGATQSCGCSMLHDLTGQRFGRLVVIKRSPNRRTLNSVTRRWTCQCDCGNETTVFAVALANGMTKSCGCLQSEVASKQMKTHGLGRTRVYNIWHNMLRRCENPLDKNYANYGGRGISVCERWHIIENLLADMGHPPRGYSIERKDNNGNYEPANCVWIPRSQQSWNTRRTVLLTHHGKSQHLEAWSREIGIDSRTIGKRLRKGWSIEQSLTVSPKVIPL